MKPGNPNPIQQQHIRNPNVIGHETWKNANNFANNFDSTESTCRLTAEIWTWPAQFSHTEKASESESSWRQNTCTDTYWKPNFFLSGDHRWRRSWRLQYGHGWIQQSLRQRQVASTLERHDSYANQKCRNEYRDYIWSLERQLAIDLFIYNAVGNINQQTFCFEMA